MFRRIMIIALLAVTIGCSAGADKAAAERGVAQFRRMLEAGRYSEIYTSASDDFRQTSSEQAAVRFLETVHVRLGPVRQATQRAWRVNVTRGVSMVSLQYATEFARGRGTENFVFRVSGDTVKLAGYQINSMDLMIGEPPAPAAEGAAPPRR